MQARCSVGCHHEVNKLSIVASFHIVDGNPTRPLAPSNASNTTDDFPQQDADTGVLRDKSEVVCGTVRISAYRERREKIMRLTTRMTIAKADANNNVIGIGGSTSVVGREAVVFVEGTALECPVTAP
jgi:hypothetical protein